MRKANNEKSRSFIGIWWSIPLIRSNATLEWGTSSSGLLAIRKPGID